jgi:hypothetical protein
MVGLSLLAASAACGVPPERPSNTPMTFSEYIESGQMPGPYLVRFPVGSGSTAQQSDAIQLCDSLVRQELRTRGWAATARNQILGIQVCLRVQGIELRVEPNPAYRGR